MTGSTLPSTTPPSPEDLSSEQRRRLRGLAHALDPVVRVGHAGLTEGVLREIRNALDSHELVKVKFLGGKDVLRAAGAGLTRILGAHLIGNIGHVAILYRRQEEPDKRRIDLTTLASSDEL